MIATNRLSTVNVRSSLRNFCCFINNFHIRKFLLKETFKEGKSSNLGFKHHREVLLEIQERINNIFLDCTWFSYHGHANSKGYLKGTQHEKSTQCSEVYK